MDIDFSGHPVSWKSFKRCKSIIRKCLQLSDRKNLSASSYWKSRRFWRKFIESNWAGNGRRSNIIQRIIRSNRLWRLLSDISYKPRRLYIRFDFSVQKRGASGFQVQSVTQTATGKDNNGTTKDLRIKLPSQDSIIRCSMYVKPMGRNVIFYFYPGNYTTGNSVGMKALMVTTSNTNNTSNTSNANNTNSTASQQTTTASQESTAKSNDDSLNSAQGLSLSTAPKTTTKKKTSSEKSVGTWILILTVSMTLSGLILLGVAAVIVYYFRKNWDKWGDDQDEYDEIYNDEN